LACSEAWLERIGSEEISEASDINNKRMKCLQRCDRQGETPTFTSSVFPVEETFSQHQFFCLALQKVSRICSNPSRFKIFEITLNETGLSCLDILVMNKTNTLCTNESQPNYEAIQANSNISMFLFNYAKKNFALLRVIIKDPYYTLIKQDEQLTTITFLGNAGGLLSLFMGLSLVSIFEICFHFLNFVWRKFQ